MAISYGQWLFWIWIGGIGLSLFKCGDWQLDCVKPQDLAWWVPAKFYYWYWDHVTSVGALVVQQSMMRIGKISPISQIRPLKRRGNVWSAHMLG